MKYIDSLNGGQDKGCFLCNHRDSPDRDGQNYVLWRGRLSFAMLNLFPYTSGHAMVAPYKHLGDLADLTDEILLEMIQLLRDLQTVLRRVVGAHGFNIGANLGRCAGAGLPGHIHMHIVPRWQGDTNFMAVFGDVRVIPTSLDELYDQLRQAGDELGLPKLSS